MLLLFLLIGFVLLFEQRTRAALFKTLIWTLISVVIGVVLVNVGGNLGLVVGLFLLVSSPFFAFIVLVVQLLKLRSKK
ncbi:hypothetical protein DBR42_00360 [Pelomonas sp. HMWF004]|nr:hypothetical protein DBR42_00360 [Pelomonas sp. HMWF004]